MQLVLLIKFKGDNSPSPLLFLDGYENTTNIQPNFRVYTYTNDILYNHSIDFTKLTQLATHINMDEINTRVNDYIADKNLDFFADKVVEQIAGKNKTGILRYENGELFNYIQVQTSAKDLELLNRNTDKKNTIKDFYEEHNNWKIFEFYTHNIPTIFIYASDSIKFASQLILAGNIACLYKNLNEIDCYDQNLIRCIYSLYSNTPNSYIVLNFASLLHQTIFNNACYFKKETILTLANCDHHDVIIRDYNLILKWTVDLIAKNKQEYNEYQEILKHVIIGKASLKKILIQITDSKYIKVL